MATLSLSAKTRHIAIAILGLALGQAELGFSTTLTVSPISVDLGPKASSQLLVLGNQTDRELRFEVSTFAWTEGEQGEMVLAPTDDLIVFPLISTIAPRSTKNVRVGLAHRAASPVERTYRVFFQELAPPQSAENSGQVRMQMRIGIPVFVGPPKPRGSVELVSAGFAASRLSFRLTNPGNRHIRLLTVSVTAEGADGAAVAAHELPAWYLLAGGERLYELVLDPGECLAVKALLVAARWSDGSVSGRVDIANGACR